MVDMGELHLTKVAVGCATIEELLARIAGRTIGEEATIETRYRPTRAEALIGGSLYWIIRHRLIARQEILGFSETESGRCVIRLGAECRPVHVLPRRAHQGWRYLAAKDAPADMVDITAHAALPARLFEDLSALALI